MSGFFLHELDKHPDKVGSIEGSNRSEAFISLLGRFPLVKQERLLIQLCREEYPMWHGQSTKDDRDQLAAMLSDTPITLVER